MQFLREVLTSEREKQGLSKPELAKKAGMSVTALYEIEDGTYSPRQGTVSKLAIALSVDWRVFYGGSFHENVAPTAPRAS